MRTPADQVVGQDGAAHPRRVGREVTRGAVLHARPFLPVVDAQLDDGVGAVEGVEFDGRALEVGQEGEVPPVGPQGRLRTAEPGAPHDEATSLVDALGHHGLATERVVDADPVRLIDPCDGGGDGLGARAHRHGVGHAQAPEHLDRLVGPITRVEADDDLSGGPGPAQAGHQLFDEALGAALGVGRSLAHPGVEDLAGVGPSGQDRVVAEHLGVTRRRRRP